MKFGIHNSSWLDRADPAEAFEAVKAKAQWAEDHGFVWFSVMDHMIQIPRVGAPDEPVLEGWTVLAGLAAVTARIRLATLCTAVSYRNPAHLGVPAVRLGVPAEAGDAHPANGGSGRADREDVDGAPHDLPRTVFPR
jgi:Luciferase-like monooxygenase